MIDRCIFNKSRSFSFNGVKHGSLFSIDNLEINDSAVNSFLKIGYVPGNLTLFKGVELTSAVTDNINLDGVFENLPEYEHGNSTLKDILMQSVGDWFEHNKDQVVPLSGGMDSRIILAALCELTDAKNIQTYTFGVPGAYDYDIPNKISQKFGTRHTNFKAEDTKYTVDGLVRAAIESDGNTEVFHPLVLNRVVDHYGTDATYWSGFAGDLVGGAFGSKISGENPKQQLIKYEKRGIHLLDGAIEDNTLYPYISNGEKMSNYVSANEACFWANHVERYTGHHIFRNDISVVAPLVDMRLLKFFFTLPVKERENKKFFNEAFSTIFSDVFKFPTADYGYKYSKSSILEPFHKIKFYYSALGWRLMPSVFTHPNSAYIDMQHAINVRSDVRGCVDTLIADLAERKLVDNERMFFLLSEHRKGQQNFTKDIINLASLEVILKAAKL